MLWLSHSQFDKEHKCCGCLTHSLTKSITLMLWPCLTYSLTKIICFVALSHSLTKSISVVALSHSQFDGEHKCCGSISLVV